MDGWGTKAKKPYITNTEQSIYSNQPYVFENKSTASSVYLYWGSFGADIDTGNGDTGLPLIRAMFLEYPDDSYASSKEMQYQYMLGSNLLGSSVFHRALLQMIREMM